MNKIFNLHTVSQLQEVYIREGIKLRPLISSDSMRLLEILTEDSSIRDKVTVASRFHTIEDIEAEIKRYGKEEGLIRYTMLKDRNPIGLVSFWRDEGYFGTAPNLDDYGFGYFLAPNERGKGLITNAVQNLMNTAIKNLHVNQFVAFCEDDNKESITVLVRLGFKPTDRTFTDPQNGWIERKYIKKL